MLQDLDPVRGALRDLLDRTPGQSKHQLLKGLSGQALPALTTRGVNRALYSDGAVFAHDDATPPRWRLVQRSATGTAGAPALVDAPLPYYYAGKPPRKWQQEAMSAWRLESCRGIVEAVTGTGKTTVGVLAAGAAVDMGMRVLVLVPGRDLLDQWHEVLQRDIPGVAIGRLGAGHRDSLYTHQILVATVQSARKSPQLPAGEGGLLVADEVHRYGAESFAAALEPAFVKRLGLTATYHRHDTGMADFLEPFFGGVVAQCTYERGLNDGILAPFRIAFLGSRFTADEQGEYDKHDSVAKSMRHRLISVHDCPAEPFGEFMAKVNDLREGGCGSATMEARRYLSAFNQRRKLLAESLGKLDALAKVAPLLAACDRGLVFGETTSCAEKAASLLNANGVSAMHLSGELSMEERRLRLGMFKAGQVKVLAAPKVLDEGIDVPQADVGVILGASRSKRQMIQRMGRIIRPKHDQRPATFIIVYVEGSAEDPENGAHEDFLEELTEIAVKIRYFGPSSSPADLLVWYHDEYNDL